MQQSTVFALIYNEYMIGKPRFFKSMGSKSEKVNRYWRKTLFRVNKKSTTQTITPGKLDGVGHGGSPASTLQLKLAGVML